MRPQAQHESVDSTFDRGTPVYTYWIERCAGFTVVDASGRQIGRVRAVDLDQHELVVTGRLKSRRVAMAGVRAVSPRSSTIHLPELEHATAAAPRANAANEDTLPWFFLVTPEAEGATSGRRSLTPILQRSRAAGHEVLLRARTKAGLLLAALRRGSTAFRARVVKLTHDARVRCARGLIRLAGAVEPRSNEGR